MDADSIEAITNGLVTVWTLVGPVVAGLLGAWLTARHQRNLETMRHAYASSESHRAWLRQERAEACYGLLETVNDMLTTSARILTYKDSTEPGASERRSAQIDSLMDLFGHANRDSAALRALGMGDIEALGKKLTSDVIKYALHDGPAEPVREAWPRLSTMVAQRLGAVDGPSPSADLRTTARRRSLGRRSRPGPAPATPSDA